MVNGKIWLLQLSCSGVPIARDFIFWYRVKLALSSSNPHPLKSQPNCETRKCHGKPIAQIRKPGFGYQQQLVLQCQTSSCQWSRKVNAQVADVPPVQVSKTSSPFPLCRNSGMVSVPYDIGGMPLRDTGISQPIPISAMASALANASPTEQRTEILKALRIQRALVLKTSFDRPNLKYEVIEKNKEPLKQLEKILTDRFKNSSGIVYWLTKK
ncbi:hypothetical protein L2E82_49974 [Cichorium intybus]|nr:hypothetical protein L2E82_49974 [Cichorium intybus]